ncbi:recombinase RecT [Alcanivorax sp.]|uniref:recombinase RecT n=1 Tax=Alcanivorax sp. TaxID=1872427 RepID=UPI003BAA63D6
MNAIAQTNGFALKPNSMQEAMQMAEMLSGSEMVPKNYQRKPQDTLVAMMMGSELGLNPIQALQNIAVINGKPAIYGDALLALVQNHPKFGGHEESFDEQTMTATCTVWRKGDDKKHTVTFSRQDAEHAKLWGKQGPWQQYPKRMLMWRARGYALRDKFADALGGLITVEEARDIPEERDITPRESEQPQSLPHYPEEDFAANFPKWAQLIQAGKKTGKQIIDMVASKAPLTEEQAQQVLAVEQGE